MVCHLVKVKVSIKFTLWLLDVIVFLYLIHQILLVVG